VKLAYSYDGGKTLIAVTACPIDVCVTCVAYNGSYWLAGGQGQYGIAKSMDGIVWEGWASPFDQGANRTISSVCTAIAWGETKWMAVGRKSVAESGVAFHVLAATSTDNGETWTDIFTSDDIFGGAPGAGAILNTVAWNGTSWLVGGTNNNDGAPKHIAVSSDEDGTTWTSISKYPGGQATSIAWNGSVWMVGGFISANLGGGVSPYKALIYSSDGVSFNNVDVTISITQQAWSIAWNGSIWVGVFQAVNDGSIIYSVDGLIWTISRDNIFIDGAGYSVVWDGSMWIAVGATTANTPVIATSLDAINWRIIPGQNVFTDRINAVATKRVLPYEGTTNSIMRFGKVNPWIEGPAPNTEITNIGFIFPGDLYMDISGRNLYKYYGNYNGVRIMGGFGGEEDITPIMNFGPIIQYGTAGTPDTVVGDSIIGVSTIRFTPDILGNNVFTSPPNVTATILGGDLTPGIVCITDVTSTCFSTFTYDLSALALSDYRFNWQAML
jgi:hypothetical protein